MGTPLKEWTEADVADWLSQIGHSDKVEQFRSEGWDGAVLALLLESSKEEQHKLLKVVGFTCTGHMMKFVAALEKVQAMSVLDLSWGDQDELERRVRGLLNKICPDNLQTIIDRLAEIELHKADELDAVIRIIFGKALAEPHYCETYADMFLAVRFRYPEFPPENQGGKPQTFTRVLLNMCQEEYECLLQTRAHGGETTLTPRIPSTRDEKRNDKILAIIKLIGNLFLRHLLAVKVIEQVVHDLIGIKERNPEEHMIECVCELLQAIGHTLDGTPQGKALMGNFAARLLDLKGVTDREGKQVYSKRIQFRIQDLLDLRSYRWQTKLFKEIASA